MLSKREKEVVQLQLDQEERVLADLKRQYTRALRDIDSKIKMLLGDELTQSRIYQANYQKALKKQVEAILEKLHADEYDSIHKYLSDSYTDSFVGTMYEISGQGIPIITPIDRNAAVKAIITDSKLSTDLYAALGYDMDELKKHIRQEITRGIATSLPYEQIARNIANKSTLPLSNANRIVRTEGHRIQQASANDARNVAKAKGADVVKQWDASLDGATRPIHRKLDGQIRETDEPFEAGGKRVMYPGKFGDPGQDCNCRCVALTRARWALDETELKTLKERAKFFDLDKTEDFEDFKKKYLKAAEAEGQKKKAKKFVPAKTIDEAESAVKKFCDDKQFGALGVSYAGISLDMANEVNKALVPLFDSFDAGMIGGIVAPAGNTKLGKQMTGAVAGYSPIRKSFILNRKSLKNLKTAQAAFDAESAALKDFIEHPERYDMNKLSKYVRSIIERSKVSGRATVPRTVEEAIQHEFGHLLERKVFASDLWSEAEKNMPEYADKISGYAGTNKGEYVAESFVSYLKGEDVIDPAMEKIFNGLRRK